MKKVCHTLEPYLEQEIGGSQPPENKAEATFSTGSTSLSHTPRKKGTRMPVWSCKPP
jgi:hypothetical protein